MGAYNLHVIKTNQFKTVNMRIMFKRKTRKEEINFRNFLSAILLETTKIIQPVVILKLNVKIYML